MDGATDIYAVPLGDIEDARELLMERRMLQLHPRGMTTLRGARERIHMTQAELGRRMCIDPSIVRHVEAGRIKPYPRFKRVASEILGVEERLLFGNAASADD